MALIGFEGFDHSTTAAHYAEKWVGRYSGSVSIQTAESRWGTGGYLQINDNGPFLGLQFPPGASEIIAGFAWWVSGLTDYEVARFNGDNGSTLHDTLTIDTRNGAVAIRRGGSTTVASGTYTKTSLQRTWVYVEVRLLIGDGTAGEAEVRINGEVVIDQAGIDTRNGGTDGAINEIMFFPDLRNNTLRWDDLYIVSVDATAPNDFLGDCRVATLMPNGNGSSSDLVGSDADSTDNYQLVNDNPPNDATYVGSGTPGDLDLYAMEDLPLGIVTVHGVQLSARASKTDTGAISGRTVLKSGTATAVGDDIVLGSTFAYGGRTVHPLEPDGNAAWTPADVNAIEAGFEVRA